nr:hypothetical protein BaRGS_007845 [Batillaria attramentaria]
MEVLKKDSSDHTKYASLSFPGASQVDVYPAEHLSDFYEYYGASGIHDTSVIALPDDNLYFLEYTILDKVFIMLLTLTAFLSCAMMASAMPDELVDLVKSLPAQDEFLIYDIRGDLSSDDVVAAFSGFNVPYKFKMLSGRRFIVVLKKESSDHTKYASLSFPGASQVDVYPAELKSDFFKYYGVDVLDDTSVIALPDDNLYFLDYTILEEGADLATYKAHMKALGDEYNNVDNDLKLRIFHITAMMPFKVQCTKGQGKACVENSL